MNKLELHEIHQGWGAVFTTVNDCEVPLAYGHPNSEYRSLRDSVALLDLGFRSRLCLLGADRKRFLHGQVSNDVNRLQPGRGCYAALVTAKGRMQSDLNIYCLQNELLLDFEPGLTAIVKERLQKYVIADDVEIVDAAPHYGLIGVAGPKALELCERAGLGLPDPGVSFGIASRTTPLWGEVYLAWRPAPALPSLQIFAPVAAQADLLQRLAGLARELGGGPCGWQTLEVARIEDGTPRFGADMDDTNLPPEAGIEASAISYSKGCYIGQEVIARVRTYGQVAKKLRGLDLGAALDTPPIRGARLLHQGREVGSLTSVVWSPRCERWIALGYVRREINQEGAVLEFSSGDRLLPAIIVPLPFAKNPPPGYPSPDASTTK
jgi:folate-binding protein YgfZ